MLATPAVSQADQGRQRAAGHPAPTVVAGVSPATHLRRRDREAAWPPGEARSSEERGAPVRCAAPAQCYCAWGETEAVTAPARALCCPPDRPGALRGASGRCTSAVSWCIGAAGRLQASLRPKVSLFPERSVEFLSMISDSSDVIRSRHDIEGYLAYCWQARLGKPHREQHDGPVQGKEEGEELVVSGLLLAG